MAHITLINALALLLTFLPLMFVTGWSLRSVAEVMGMESYTIGTMNFKGTIHGVETELSGTAEEIYAKFSELHPEVVANATLAARDDTFDLETRDFKDLYCCPVAGTSWWGANTYYIKQGIQYLQNLHGYCGVSRGPGQCVRVSCSWNSGIYLCNDNGYAIDPDCGDIAAWADGLTKVCNTYNDEAADWFTCGQWFDTQSYNVIVHGDGC